MSTPFQLDPADPPEDIKIRVSYECETCKGEGRVPWGPPGGTSECMFCECRRKEVVVPLADFVKLLARHQPGPAQAPVAPEVIHCLDCDLWQRRVVTCSACKGEKVVTEWVPVAEIATLLEVRS